MPEPSGNHRNSADISVDLLIVGAGFSGICMGIRLLEAGMKSFLVIEKSDDLGGTWYENRYPGCACDVPAHLYSFSFERNPGWTRMFASQQEIWQYLKSCVQRYGLASYIRFNTCFHEAAWNESAGQWRISASDNSLDNLSIRARVLISGMGAYRTAFGRRRARGGRQEEKLVGATIWVLPNPSGRTAGYQMPALARAFRHLRRSL